MCSTIGEGETFTDDAGAMESTTSTSATYTDGTVAMYSTTGEGVDGGLDRERTGATYCSRNK